METNLMTVQKQKTMKIKQESFNLNKKRGSEQVAFFLFRACGLITLILLGLIVGKVLLLGIPNIDIDFLTKGPENMGKEGGVLPFIVTTFMLTLLSLLFAAPIGIGGAIFLTEYAGETPLVKLIRFATESLAGIPSIIYGLFGYAFFVVFLGLKYSILSGALTLTFMILPTITRTAEEAILMVPKHYREASLALGATKWQTIRKVVLPAASSGILTGVILGIGRVVGETAAVIYTAGSTLNMPDSFLRPGRTLSVHLYILASEGISKEKMYATAAILIILVFIINTAATKVMKRMINK